MLPLGREGHVRKMQVYGEEATIARAGECAALNLPEIDHLEVRRGMVLGPVGAVAPVTMVEAELRVLASVQRPLEDYFEAHLHIGTASVLVPRGDAGGPGDGCGADPDGAVAFGRAAAARSG